MSHEMFGKPSFLLTIADQRPQDSADTQPYERGPKPGTRRAGTSRTRKGAD